MPAPECPRLEKAVAEHKGRLDIHRDIGVGLAPPRALMESDGLNEHFTKQAQQVVLVEAGHEDRRRHQPLAHLETRQGLEADDRPGAQILDGLKQRLNRVRPHDRREMPRRRHVRSALGRHRLWSAWNACLECGHQVDER